MRKLKRGRPDAGRAFDAVNGLLIALFCAAVLFPLWNLVVVSFSRPEDVSLLRVNLWPKAWSLDAFRYCLTDPLLVAAFVNSVLRTLLGSVYDLVICCATAFALTRSDMPLRKTLTFYFLITMFFSGGMIPTYLNIRSLGLINCFWVYILPNGFDMYNTIIIRNYFLSIDRSMEEAATIDGASVLKVLTRVILPLSLPVLATVGMWRLVAHWNTWFDNLVYVRDDGLITLQYMLHKIQNNAMAQTDKAAQFALSVEKSLTLTPQSILSATTLIVILPIVCVYPFLQRYFVKGIMLGAVKG